jgi:DNA-binding transcriptional regulator YiaG
MKKKYQSEALMVCHQSARDLFDLGIIDSAKMREFDEDCLVPESAAKTPGTRKIPAPVHTQPRRA